MLKFKFLVFTIFLVTQVFCQKAVLIDRYVPRLDLNYERQIVIEMPFGYYNILNITGDTLGLPDAGDIFVDVICTDYPVNASLQVLNKNRLKTFLERFPYLKQQQLAQVNYFQQTDGQLRERAMTMFHGLVIKYRPRQTIENMVEEVAKLEELLKPVAPDTKINDAITRKRSDSITTALEKKYKNRPRKFENGSWYIQVGRAGIYSADDDYYKKAPEDSSVTLSPKEALKEEMIDKSTYKEFRKSSLITLYYTRWFKLDPVSTDKPKEETVTIPESKNKKMPDSTLGHIFDRTNWTKTVVVGDVTGSMYPYTAQLLLWIKINALSKLTPNYVFFNDGDNMPDKHKKLGKTGGIYSKVCKDFDDVKSLVRSTMLKGGGGDFPENNIEALLKAEIDFPESEFLVLIADNLAPIKDKVLWKYLTKPVRVVLCGATEFNVNVDYLNLARKTKGSLHLMERDLYDLTTLHEGEILRIGKNSFIIKNGMFADIREDYRE